MTTRARLTLWFAVVVSAIAAAVLGVLLLARSAYVYRDLGFSASAQAQIAERLIEQTATAGDGITVRIDSGGPRTLSSRLRDLLETVPAYLMVLDTSGTIVYGSRALAELPAEDWTFIQSNLAMLPDDGPAGLLPVSGGLLFVARSIDGKPEGVSRVVVGIHTSGALALPRQYAVTLGFILALVILGSIWGAYLILGGPSRQLDNVARELAAITDGRSLHRRLSAADRGSELELLVNTLNAMLARLEGSFAALRRFTADASHELKTPLAVLRADVERAMNEAASPAERAVGLEEALHETRRMSDLVESLLTLARADEGRLDIVREPVDLAPLVREVLETAAILGEGAGVTVTMPFIAEVTVVGDRARLRQLFLNLVTNAIKYTPSGGRVDVGLGSHPDNVTFAVRDTGIGIAAADIPFIFDRFWRADRARSRAVAGPAGSDRAGFGLGLAISQWIVQAHGGSLTVSSRLGMGSVFMVTLPVADDKQADAPMTDS